MPKMKLTDGIAPMPRKVDKRKHHRPGFSEDVQDRRQARVQFKQYLRQLEESQLDGLDDLDDLDDLDEDTE